MPSELRSRQQRVRPMGAILVACGAGLGLAALAIATKKRKHAVYSGPPSLAHNSSSVTAARELNQGSGMLALSVLCDSARALQGQFLQ